MRKENMVRQLVNTIPVDHAASFTHTRILVIAVFIAVVIGINIPFGQRDQLLDLRSICMHATTSGLVVTTQTD
jgi:hypothetical protein